MIVVKIEIWPGGDESKAREHSRAYIHNTGKESAETHGTYGDYSALFIQSEHFNPVKPVVSIDKSRAFGTSFICETASGRKKMKKFSIEHVSNELIRKRGDRGIRAVAKEIGISPSTLSRIENSKMPDLKTFHKVCAWLGYDMETATSRGGKAGVMVHFKKDQAIKEGTARALADLIIAAQHQLMLDAGLDPNKKN